MTLDEQEDETPKPRRRKDEESVSRGPRSGDILFFLVVFLIVVFVVVISIEKIPEYLFNKYAGLIYLIMLVEYVVLKSMDRTRVYERENGRLREKLRIYRRLIQRSEKILTTVPNPNAEPEDVEEKARWKALAQDCAEEIRKTL